MNTRVASFAVLTSLLSVSIAAAQSGPTQPASLAGANGPPATANSSASNQSGETLLRGALAAMDAHQAVSAKLRQQVDLFGHRLVGSGGYLQQGRGEACLLRLELKFQVDDQVSSLQHVCDGKFLWMHQDLLGKNSLSKIDVKRVRRAWRDTRGVSVSPQTQLLALGGLPQLLANLNDGFYFRPATKSRLDGLSVWTLQGEWHPERLVEMLPDQKAQLEAGQAVDLSRLPPQVPERVTIMLGRDDLFPYRIEYARRQSVDKKKSSTPGELKQVVLLELFEVQLGVPVDPRLFVYNPGGLEAPDQTTAYLKSLRLDQNTQAEPEAERLVPVRR